MRAMHCVFALVVGFGHWTANVWATDAATQGLPGDRAKLCLDGTWKFYPAFEEIKANHEFLQDGLAQNRGYPADETDRHFGWIEPCFDDTSWWDISVPASWNTEFDDLWSYEGEGWYRRKLDIPREWEGQRVLLEFDGANYRTVAYVNGKRAGIHEGGYTRFAFRIDPFLSYGNTNTIAVAVDNESRLDRVPMERHDWWDHGGLYRPVRIVVTNTRYIDDVVVTTETIGPPARIHVSAVVCGLTDRETETSRLVVRLEDADNRVAATAMSQPCIEESDECPVALDLEVEDPRLWSPDRPSLYTLVLELRMIESDTCRDSWRTKVGIRTIAVEKDRLLVNGKPFLVKGVCRYENYFDTGMTSSDAGLARDLALIKGLGANAVRCHYTYGPATYDALDREGIFAVCEVPLYQWGRTGHSEKNLEAAQQQLEEMIRTLGNHPSVMMWSVSNENNVRPRESGEEQDRLSTMVRAGNMKLVALAHRLDPTRPVIEPSNRWPEDPVLAETDLNSVNVYIGVSPPNAEGLTAMPAAIRDRFRRLRELHPDKPILATEFGCWALRGLQTDYFPGEGFQAQQLRTEWETFLGEPGFIGGFVWCFADSDVHRKFTGIYEMRCAYGLFDLQRRPKRSAEVVRQLWSGDDASGQGE